MRKDFLNGDAGGGVYYWTSRDAAEAWYTPEWRNKAKAIMSECGSGQGWPETNV